MSETVGQQWLVVGILSIGLVVLSFVARFILVYRMCEGLMCGGGSIELQQGDRTTLVSSSPSPEVPTVEWLQEELQEELDLPIICVVDVSPIK